MLHSFNIGDNPIKVAGPAGQLEAIITLPQNYLKATRIAIICHPHSLHGGSMTNKVVHSVARACVDKNCIAIRFNFRGVGRSEGNYDEGIGESEDLKAIVQWVRMRAPQLKLILAGFSFGSFVSLMSHSKVSPHQLISVAPPIKRFNFESFKKPECPWLVIAAEKDELVELKAVQEWLSHENEPDIFHVIEESSHFFHGKLNELRAVIEAHLIE